jgi:site-specific DNA recombinase
MTGYFAYIRVSTVKQGERGTSLDEQRSAIEAYASRNDLQIAEWFQEMETAAKQGRRQFTRMLGELKKGRAYYRCHSRECRGTSLREADVDKAVMEHLAAFALTEEELRDVRDLAREVMAQEAVARDTRAATRERDLAKCEDRLSRLTDAFLDGLVDRETFELRKGALLEERLALRTETADPTADVTFEERVVKYLELANTAYLGFELANSDEKREIVRELTSNLVANGKNVEITLRNEFQQFQNSRILH